MLSNLELEDSYEKKWKDFLNSDGLNDEKLKASINLFNESDSFAPSNSPACFGNYGSIMPARPTTAATVIYTRVLPSRPATRRMSKMSRSWRGSEEEG